MTKLKICGLMNARDVEMCIDCGADVLGFVVGYPVPVPWGLEIDAAAELIKIVRGRADVCAVTGGRAEHIEAVCRELMPDLVQLHGGEDIETTRRCVLELSGLGINVIKTVPPSREERMEQFGTEDASRCAALAEKAGAAMLLADSRTRANAAIGGGVFDGDLYRAIRAATKRPVILAGGLRPENALDAIADLDPYMIDVLSGSETAPGEKDRAKIEALRAAVRGASGKK